MSNNCDTDRVSAINLEPETVKIAMERWQKVTFANRFMFRLVMEDPEICKRTLEVVLGINIRKLVYQEAEKSFEAQLLSKGVRLDVYIEDADGVMYDLEMQASDADGQALGRRTRYYQSMMDTNQLKKGEHYSQLKKSIMIFICCYDPFELNFRRYTFSNLCHEKKDLELDDDSYKVFINAKGTEGKEKQNLLNFIDFLNTGKGKDDFTEKLEEAVRLNHMDEEKAVTYMTWEQEMQTVALRERLAEKFEIAKKMKTKGMSLEDIIDITGLTAEQIAMV